ncbi:MAG: acetyl-CoA carboxylase biotin carboxylase subunit [Coriobacteriales bacterium]|jgi:acetyl-CoA carboxylase biotin carboxylase subunit|nr:acetyl-CoA carboxylase biotin carboxylase subunit [Coriobacteriales bacterium]
MLKRVLVANRGEIATRIIHACREMNIETVAVFSEADRGALFTTLANRAICIGGAHASESYLNQQAIVMAAIGSECDAIHPGFGFLSENASFAALAEEYGLTFIGPPPSVIETFGDKNIARALMRENDIPVVPGSEGLIASVDEAHAVAEQIGYPVLIKAASGGGGRGIRQVNHPDEMDAAFHEAMAEALACFGEQGVYLEKLILNPRHIEFQILADTQGTILHLGDRDCSVQRNRQKLIEEAPAQALSAELREHMGQTAVKAAQVARYVNAGTVEFILDDTGSYYFIEMNTRIQVEHPVTEMITGINIVREQIRIASGLPLPLTQDEVSFDGHAMECRINAEDPDKGFAPSPGHIDYLHLPSGFGIRVDTAMHQGYTVSPYYDSMIAKIIVRGHTRNETVLRMRRALEETLVQGVKTNLSLLYMIMYSPDFIANHIDTGFIERNLETLLSPMTEDRAL